MVAKDTSVVAQVMWAPVSRLRGGSARTTHPSGEPHVKPSTGEIYVSPASTEGPSFQGGSPLQRGAPLLPSPQDPRRSIQPPASLPFLTSEVCGSVRKANSCEECPCSPALELKAKVHCLYVCHQTHHHLCSHMMV